MQEDNLELSSVKLSSFVVFGFYIQIESLNFKKIESIKKFCQQNFGYINFAKNIFFFNEIRWFIKRSSINSFGVKKCRPKKIDGSKISHTTKNLLYKQILV